MRTIRLFFLIGFFPLVLLWGRESWKLYDDSQVAVVEITVDPLALFWMMQNVESDSLHLATVHFKNAWIDETIDSVGIRIRGNTSRYSQKKSLKLSFNTFVAGRQFYGVDKLNLNGEHNDPSIIRSKLCWDFFQDIGLTASRAAHAVVYINGDYVGLYISVEHIDDEFLQNHYSDDSGNLWKCLYPADLTYRGPNPEDYHPYTDGKRPYELKTNTGDYDYSQLVRLIDIINNTSDRVFAESLEDVFVVPEILKYLTMNVLLGSWDDYWFLMNNYYLYYEPAIDKFHWIPYDYDNTFGIDWFNIDWATVDPYVFANFEEAQGQSPGPRPLVRRIMANDQFRDLYSHFLEFYRENVCDLSLWESKLDSLKTLITPWAETDILRTLDWGFTIDDFHDSYTAGPYENQHVKRGIKDFVNTRNNRLSSQVAYMDAKPGIYALDWFPRNPQPDDSIRVTASVFSSLGLSDVSIQFLPEDITLVENYAMRFQPVLNTKIVEEADRWVGVIPPMGEGGYGHFQIYVSDLTGQTQFYPRINPVKIQSSGGFAAQIFINEFLAQNDLKNMDDAGEYDDWVELYNPTAEDVFLSGMYLTDNPDDLTKWQFPFGGVCIASNGYLLIWCDGDLNQSGLHANFRLSAGGEYIGLVASDGVTIVDSLTFGPQSGDISFGRNPDGSDTWTTFLTPTPEGPNSITHILEDRRIPERIQLYQNHPNPFNPETTIRYDLPERCHVTIVIYDALGRQMRNLVSGQQDAGTRLALWDGTDDSGRSVSAGVYLYQIRAGEYKQTRKLLLLR